MEFDFSPIWASRQYLLGGLGITLLLSLTTVALSLAVGGAIGIARCYGPRWLTLPLTFYIDSMRSVPVLVVLVWVYFACPILFGLTLPPFWAALTALTLHIAAYVADIVRAGITRSEEHTSELQSPDHLVCRLLLEKKKLCRASSSPRCAAACLSCSAPPDNR